MESQVSREARGAGKPIARPGRKSVAREYAEAFFFAIVLTLVIRSFVIQAFRIPSGSMENTLLVGDFLFVNKFLYGAPVPFTDARLPAIREPKRGDVIVFKYPEDPRVDYIKRCIGTPGDTVEIRDKVVYINGQALDEPYVKFADSHIRPKAYGDPSIVPHGAGNKDNFGPIVVPAHNFFMMGDNRDRSADSRYWGFMDYRLIKGKAIFIYFSWDTENRLFGFVPVPRFGRVGHLIH